MTREGGPRGSMKRQRDNEKKSEGGERKGKWGGGEEITRGKGKNDCERG